MADQVICRITKVSEFVLDLPDSKTEQQAWELARMMSEGVFGEAKDASYWTALRALFDFLPKICEEQAALARARAPVGCDGDLSFHGGSFEFPKILALGLKRYGDAFMAERRMAAHG